MRLVRVRVRVRVRVSVSVSVIVSVRVRGRRALAWRRHDSPKLDPVAATRSG